jgi:hypothetical protein
MYAVRRALSRKSSPLPLYVATGHGDTSKTQFTLGPDQYVITFGKVGSRLFERLTPGHGQDTIFTGIVSVTKYATRFRKTFMMPGFRQLATTPQLFKNKGMFNSLGIYGPGDVIRDFGITFGNDNESPLANYKNMMGIYKITHKTLTVDKNLKRDYDDFFTNYIKGKKGVFMILSCRVVRYHKHNSPSNSNVSLANKLRPSFIETAKNRNIAIRAAAENFAETKRLKRSFLRSVRTLRNNQIHALSTKLPSVAINNYTNRLRAARMRHTAGKATSMTHSLVRSNNNKRKRSPSPNAVTSKITNRNLKNLYLKY